MNVVLDTNCLIMSLSPNKRYFDIWESFINGSITLCVSNDILEEYDEVIGRNINKRVADIVLRAIIGLPNVKFVDPHFHFWMVKNDVDDNKFTDCAVAAHARYIVTEDHHFKSVSSEGFPKVNIIDIDKFLDIINNAAIHRE